MMTETNNQLIFQETSIKLMMINTIISKDIITIPAPTDGEEKEELGEA